MENFREDRSMSENRTFRAHLLLNNTPFVVTDCTCTSPSIRASVRSGDATTARGGVAPLTFVATPPSATLHRCSSDKTGLKNVCAMQVITVTPTPRCLSVCGVEEKADQRTCVLSIDRAERQNGDGCVRAMQADLSRNYLIRPKRGWRAWE